MNGNIGCFTGGHIPLALLAIAVLVITILLIPVIGLISLKRRLIKVHKIKRLACGPPPILTHCYQ